MNSSRSPVAGRILALDYGMARIGVALSDPMKIIATPHSTLQAEKSALKNAEKVVELIAQVEKEKGNPIEEVVVGVPYRMNGQIGLQADEVLAFIKELEAKVMIPVTKWDERLTTVQAERAMREGNMSRKQRSKVIDQAAAVIILQSYLERRSFQAM
jgi:putative Holliday junction resolvase